MRFERRDILLIAGLLLFMIGLIPFMAPVYAVAIAIIMYFGIKFYVGRKRQMLAREIGEGVCADCGSQIYNKTCPECSSKDS